MEYKKITNFTDLLAWKEGHKLVIILYSTTKKFPKEEIFGLVSQMRRAAVSITSNIAEGFGRYSYNEKIRFYTIAKGSLTELQNQIIISKDVKFINQNDYQLLFEQSITAHKLINGLIAKSKHYNQS